MSWEYLHGASLSDTKAIIVLSCRLMCRSWGFAPRLGWRLRSQISETCSIRNPRISAGTCSTFWNNIFYLVINSTPSSPSKTSCLSSHHWTTSYSSSSSSSVLNHSQNYNCSPFSYPLTNFEPNCHSQTCQSTRSRSPPNTEWSSCCAQYSAWRSWTGHQTLSWRTRTWFSNWPHGTRTWVNEVFIFLGCRWFSQRWSSSSGRCILWGRWGAFRFSLGFPIKFFWGGKGSGFSGSGQRLVCTNLTVIARSRTQRVAFRTCGRFTFCRGWFKFII